MSFDDLLFAQPRREQKQTERTQVKQQVDTRVTSFQPKVVDASEGRWKEIDADGRSIDSSANAFETVGDRTRPFIGQM